MLLTGSRPGEWRVDACLITHVGLSVMTVRKEMGESCEGEINTECWCGLLSGV